MYKLEFTSKFKKDLKRIARDTKKKQKTNEVLIILEKKGVLPEKYKTHKLTGNYKGLYECHIMPNLLLIWSVEKKTVKLIRIGSHSELFK